MSFPFKLVSRCVSCGALLLPSLPRYVDVWFLVVSAGRLVVLDPSPYLVYDGVSESSLVESTVQLDPKVGGLNTPLCEDN